MALDVDTLVQAMTAAGQNLGSSVWNDMQSLALPELKKIAMQIVEIEANAGSYTPAGAKALLDMQIRASVAVVVAMTTLTMLSVQDALNQILSAVKTLVNSAVKFTLIV